MWQLISSRAFPKTAKSLQAPLGTKRPATIGRITVLLHGASAGSTLICWWSIARGATGQCRLIAAAGFTGVDVTAIASAVSEVHIRECFLCGHIGSVDAIANQVIGSDVELGIEHAGNCARRNINYVVGNSASVRKTCAIAGEQAHPAPVSRRSRRYTGVQSQ